MNNTGKNEPSGYKLFEKMCAETDQDRWHRQEVLRQNDFVIEATRGGKKTHDHQNTFARNISTFPTDGDWTGIFTLDVPVIIINV